MRKIYLPAKLFKNLILFFTFLLFAFWANAQTNIASGNTVAASTIPAGNTITINAGGTLNMDVSKSFASITTAGTGTSNIIGANTVTLSGSITINSTNNNPHTLAISATSTVICTSIIRGAGGNNSSVMNVTVSGILKISGTVFSGAAGTNNLNCNSGSTVEYNGAGQTVYATTYSNLTLSGSGVKALNSSTVNAILSMQGIATTSGTVSYGASSTLEYKGSAAQTTGVEFISPFPGSGGVVINNANGTGVTLGSAKSVGANPFTIGSTVANSIFNDGVFQLTSTGTFTLTSGTFNIGSGATATSYPAFGTSNIAAGNTVNYNSTASQTIAAVNYYNLSNSANGPRTLPGSGTVGIAGTLSPGTGSYTVTSGSTVSFNGTAAQTIPTINPAATFAFYNLAINNPAGISAIANDITVTSSLALTSGIVTTAANKIIISSGGFVSRPVTGGWVYGNLQKAVNPPPPPLSAFDFEIGDATYYCPLTVKYAVVNTAGSLIATVTTSPAAHPAIATSGLDNTKTVTRYWRLTKVGSLAGTYDATFNYNSGSVPGIANTSNFVVREYNSSAWVTPVPATGARNATSTQATGLTAYGDFCVGETTGVPTVSVNPVLTSSVCVGGGTTFTSSSSSTPSPTIQWQRSNDNGATWDNITAATDGTGIYTNFTTTTLTIANSVASMNGYLYRAQFTNINGVVSSNSSGGKLIVSILPVITTMTYPSSTFSTASPAQSGPTFTGSNYTGGIFAVSPSSGLANFNTSTGAFTPIGSSIGTYTITYSVTNGACTPVSKSATVTISSAAISYLQSAYCSSDGSSQSLIFSGFTENLAATISVVSVPGTANLHNTRGTFTPSGADPGTYTVTYTDGSVVLSTTVTVTQLPAATINYSNVDICNLDATPYPVSYSGTTGAYTGGIFSYTPTVAGHSLNIVASGGTVANPLGSVTGSGSNGDIYSVVYTIPASGGCPAVATSPTVVTITAIPAATLTYGTGGYPICKVASSTSPTITGLPAGGTFTQPVGQTGLTVNASGVIDPGTSTPGTYNVIYTVNSGTSCGDVSITSANIVIVDNPSLAINYSSSNYCTGDAGVKTVTFTGTGSYAGATFAPSPSGLTIDANSGAITPSSSIAAAGSPYLVTATIPNCPLATPITAYVEIDPSPSASISYPATSFCELDGAQYPVTITGTTGGYFTYTSSPSGLILNIDQPTGGSITPSGSNPGIYTILYTVTNGSCSTSASSVITITPKVGAATLSLAGGSTEPSCQITASTPTTTYTATATNNTGINWSISPGAAGSISSAGVVTWTVGFSGTATISVQAQGCGGSISSASRNVIITPSVTPPVFTLGATSTRCQGAGIVTYDAAATNTTGITYSLDGASITGGNSIVPTTGDVTFAAGWSGTSVITASAAGCNGPLTATHTVTITPTVGTPVFSLGATSTRCQGAGPVTYTATATNNTGIAYSLDATSLGAGNTIVPGTGVVTYTAGWSGTSTITASATGCNGPVTATHTVTVTPTVTIAAFSPATSTRCQGAGTVTTTTTATNSTGITYSLDAASITGGNTIIAATGAVTYAATWSGITTITASAAGCNGPATTTLVVTVNATAVGGTVTPTLKTECYNLNSATITLGGNTGTVIRWEQSVDFGVTWTTALVTNSVTYTYTNLTQTTFFRAVVQSGVCVTTANSAIAQVIVNPAFVATITPSPATACIGQPLTLTASGYTSSGLVIDGGTFVANQPPGWTGNINVSASNNSANGDMDWGLTNQNTKVYNGQPYGSPTWPYFIVGGLTATNQSTTHEAILTTPVFSLVGMSTAGLAFNEGYHFSTGTFANIEISTDASHLVWTSIRPTLTGFQAPYNTSTLGPTTFIDLNAYLGRSNLQIRFFYHGTTGSVWALDNVVVTNSASNPTGVGALNPLTYSWSPSTDLNVTNTQSVILTATTTGVKTYTVTTTAGTCTPTTTNVTVTVNPTPSITAMTSAVCSATAFSVTPLNGTNGTVPTGTTYSWGLPVVTGGLTGVATGSGAATITGTLTNPTNTAQTATYTVTPLSGTCTGATFTVTITVNPKSSITPITAVTCSGTVFTVTPVNGTNGIVPAGTTYSWSAPSVTGLMTGGALGTNALNISGTLTNPTNTAQTATYTVTPTSGTCPGSSFTVTVTVNPTPSITAMTAAICSGGTFSVTPVNGTNGLVPSGTTYSWSTPAVTSGITGGASGSGAASIGGTLSNSTTAAGTATYTVTPTSGTCPGIAFTVNVTVNPVTVAGTLPSVSVCTSGTGTLTLTGNTGSVVRWESSLDNFATAGTVIANTTILQNYSAAATTIYYRAYVQSGTCTAAYSNIATVGLHNVWTGFTSTDWNTASNWSDGLLPSNSCPDVIITNVANKPVLSSGIATINNLVINSGASLTVTGIGVTLQIAGTITNSGGTFNVTNGSLDFNGTVPQTIVSSVFSGNTLKNLTVSNTSLAVSGGGGLLNITGDLAFGNVSGATLTTNNNIVLVSTDTSTARVADITNGGARSGNSFNGQVTVQRYFPALRAWRLITSPLSGTGNIFNSWQNGGLPATIAPGNGTYVTGTVVGTGGTGNGLDNGPFLNPSLKTGSYLADVNNTVTTKLSNSTGKADNIGYLMFVRGDRNPINTTIPNTNTTTLSSKGNLQTGTQTFQAIDTLGAFTLIGNPYASPVDLNKVTLNNLAKRFYVWDPKLNLVGGYILLDDYYNTGTFNITPPSPDGKANQFIQSSEAFFVQTSSDAPASIIFNEDDKSSSNNLSMFRPMNPGQMQSFRTNLYLLNDDGSTHLADGNLAEFDDSYHPGVDLQDALKFYNVNETIGLLSGNTLLGVNRRPPLANSDTLFYKFIKNRQRKYQFEFIAAQLERDNLAGFVEDKFLNKLSPLNMNNTTKLNFEVTGDAASAAADRFRVVFKPSVVYTKVAATVLNSDIGIEWNVANEFDIKSYDVERSTDGTNFTKLGTVVSSGNSTSMVTYNWLDVSPALGNYYYRVRSISNSNVVGHSNVVKVKINKSTPAIYVFPNPVTQNEIHLQMNSMPQGVYNVRLINNLGQVILANRISHASGTSTETMRPDTRLLSGIYQLQVTAPDKKITMVKVIVD